MWFDLPLYAVQRSSPDRWLVLAFDDDPFTPAVRVVAVVAEPDYSGSVMRQRPGDSVLRCAQVA
jgi:hypothetical protein